MFFNGLTNSEDLIKKLQNNFVTLCRFFRSRLFRFSERGPSLLQQAAIVNELTPCLWP